MKLVIQRVKYAKCEVVGELVSEIGPGMMVLVGVDVDDTEEDARKMAAKTAALRIFDDAAGVMNLDVRAAEGQVMAISQFTLLAQTRKGNRPSYIRAARPEKSLPLYELYCTELEHELGAPVERGIFGADMAISLLNSGPVTIILDSRV